KYAFAGFAKGDVGRVDILISDSPLYTSIAVTDNGSGFAQDGGRGGRPESAHTGAAAPHHAPSHSDAALHHAPSHSDAAQHHTGAAALHHAPSHSDAAPHHTDSHADGAPRTNDAPASGSAAGLGLSIVRNIVGSKLGGHLEVHSGETGTSVTFDFKHEERRETPSPRKLKAVKETL
ncbi:MAG: hypothetical protein LBG82_02475, partial [Clostridiales Family XIII bacterium]|nr:hypothetical protein [Clostridiales Family XIII bacterium]